MSENDTTVKLPSLRELATAEGLTSAQIESKAFKLCENAIVSHQVSIDKSARQAIEQLWTTASRAQHIANNANSDASAAEVRVRQAEARIKQAAVDLNELVDKLNAGMDGLTIQDEFSRDGVLVFRETLKAVQEIFGKEAMTSDVICQAITAGSYGMWRSIMGPKDNQSARNRYSYKNREEAY